MSDPTTNAIENEGPDAPHPLEIGLDEYPLRSAGEDPRWALNIVWVWTGIALFLLVALYFLTVLGVFYD